MQYHNTPNTQIPLNNREPGTVADIAKQQLAQYQDQAKVWSIEFQPRDGREAMVCSECGQALWFKADRAGHAYVYTPQMKDALIVGHIRRSHSEIISEPI